MDQRARSGNAAAFDFPRSMLDSGDHEFSFSGLKTSLRYLLAKMDPAAMAERLDDLCASYQAAIVEILTRKALAAVRATGRRALAVSGGVSRNSALRDSLARACGGEGVELLLAPADLATDNAAMIGYAALLKHRAGQAPSALSEDIDPNLALPVNAGWP
jgi:N6-L-threonylcarbamoyladenine synthase